MWADYRIQSNVSCFHLRMQPFDFYGGRNITISFFVRQLARAWLPYNKQNVSHMYKREWIQEELKDTMINKSIDFAKINLQFKQH